MTVESLLAKRGGVAIELRLGLADAQLRAQLKLIAEVVLELDRAGVLVQHFVVAIAKTVEGVARNRRRADRDTPPARCCVAGTHGMP